MTGRVTGHTYLLLPTSAVSTIVSTTICNSTQQMKRHNPELGPVHLSRDIILASPRPSF